MVLGPKCSTVVTQLLKRLQALSERAHREDAQLDQADLKTMIDAQMTILSVLDTLVQAGAPDACVPAEWPQERPVPEPAGTAQPAPK